MDSTSDNPSRFYPRTTTIMSQKAQLKLELQKIRESEERNDLIDEWKIKKFWRDIDKKERKILLIHESEESYKEEGRYKESTFRARRNRENEGSKEVDEVKVKISLFLGESNSNHYLEWEMKLEKIFSCHNFDDKKKKIRWPPLIWRICTCMMEPCATRRRRPTVNTSADLKRELRDRFVPTYYARDLHIKLQRFYQCSKSVKDYYKEMKIGLSKAQLVETQETIMARFLHGLNKDIQDVVELHNCFSLEEFIHQTTKKVLKQVLVGEIGKETSLREKKSQKKGSGEKITSTENDTNGEFSLHKGDLLTMRRLLGSIIEEETKS
ncbi:hypothetical protein CR513_15972, partial [Mucuna pruriens]